MMIQIVDAQQKKRRLDMMRRAIEYDSWMVAEHHHRQASMKSTQYYEARTIPPLPPRRDISFESYIGTTDEISYPHAYPFHFDRPRLETIAPYNHLHQRTGQLVRYSSYSGRSTSASCATTASFPPLEVRRTDRSTALWNTKFEELKAFKAKYGTCNVPQCDPENKQLGVWLRNQRTGYNLYKTKGKGRGMTAERIQLLESLGVEWRINAKHVPWQQRFEELKAYAKEHGHCSIPGTDMKHKQLRIWLRNQRKGYSLYKAKGKGRGMTEERVRLLKSIGALDMKQGKTELIYEMSNASINGES